MTPVNTRVQPTRVQPSSPVFSHESSVLKFVASTQLCIGDSKLSGQLLGNCAVNTS